MIVRPESCSAWIIRSALSRPSFRHWRQPSSSWPGTNAPVNGFSMTACLPAFSERTTMSSWNLLGTHASTMSTSGSFRASSRLA